MTDRLVRGLRVLQQRMAEKDPAYRYSFNFFACVDLATRPCVISVTCLARGIHHERIAEADTVADAIAQALVWAERHAPWTDEAVAKTLGIQPAA